MQIDRGLISSSTVNDYHLDRTFVELLRRVLWKIFGCVASTQSLSIEIEGGILSDYFLYCVRSSLLCVWLVDALLIGTISEFTAVRSNTTKMRITLLNVKIVMNTVV